MPSVLKAWVFDLPFRMQSVLMSALRGCDTARKDDVSKAVTRAIRPVMCNNADPSNTFMGETFPPEDKLKQFLWDLDSYPMHFVAHTMHAAEIIGYKHPDEKLREKWVKLYKDMVLALHLNFETESQLDVRLGFTPAEGITKKEPNRYDMILGAPDAPEPVIVKPKTPKPKRPRKPRPPRSHAWDAGTGTSHGGRERVWSGGS